MGGGLTARPQQQVSQEMPSTASTLEQVELPSVGQNQNLQNKKIEFFVLPRIIIFLNRINSGLWFWRI